MSLLMMTKKLCGIKKELVEQILKVWEEAKSTKPAIYCITHQQVRMIGNT